MNFKLKRYESIEYERKTDYELFHLSGSVQTKVIFLEKIVPL